MRTAPTLFISGTNSATFNKVEGNFVDTDVSGTNAATATNPGGTLEGEAATTGLASIHKRLS